MNLFTYQLKQAWLNLKKKPGFVVSVVSSMGIMLGVLLCVLTLAYVMLIKPLPYPKQDKLFQIEQRQIDNKGEHNVSGFNYPGLVDFYQNQEIFSQASMVDYGVSSLISHPNTPVIEASYVTPEWFSLLNAKLNMGRYFSEKEGLNSFAPVAVISYKAWQRLFNGDKNILGKRVSTKNKTYSIIGVLAENFIEPALNETGYESDFWFPWDFNTSPERVRKVWWGRAHQRTIIGQLADKYSLVQATNKSTTYVNQTWQEKVATQEYFKGWHVEIKLNSFADKIIGDSRRVVYLLVVSVVCMVLIAMMNIINLFTSRLFEGRHNLSIHASVGAKPNAIFKTLFIETSLLIIASLLVAIVIALFGFELLQHYLVSALPRVSELSLNGFTFLSALLLGGVVIFTFSILGAKSINYKMLNQGLTTSGKGNKAQISVSIRNGLVIGQISIAAVLIFVCSYISLKAIDQITFEDGLKAENLLSLQLRMFADELPSAQERDVLMDQVKQALIVLPEVDNVSRSSSPLTGYLNTWSLLELDSMKRVLPQGRIVDHQYFLMSGQRLIEGNLFTEQQVQDKVKNLIINQQLADIIAPNNSALGKRLSFGSSADDELAFVVSGVVSGLKIPGETSIPPQVYRPLNNAFNMTILLRENQTLTKERIMNVLAEVSSIFKIFKLEKLTALKNNKLFAYFVSLTVTVTITIVSILLTFIGLYGILSYSSQMRRFEIGTRMAVGARGKDIIGLIVKDNVRTLLTGIMLSMLILLVFYLGFSDHIRSYLNLEMIPLFVITIVVIALTSFIACYLPLRKYISKPAIHSLRGSE
jgi:predicted permease